jgi:hypothetical protein
MKLSNNSLYSKQMLLKLGLLGLFAAGSMSITGCTDGEVAFGAGAIVGAIATDVIQDGGHDHGHYAPPPPHYPGPGHHGHWDWSGDSNQTAAMQDLDARAAANHFAVHEYAGAKILDALEAAQNRDFSALEKLGLSRDELIGMARGENPSPTSLQRLSEELKIDLGSAHAIIQQMKVDLQNAR